jgi:hypothetical protein
MNQPNVFTLYITIEDLHKVDVKYVLSNGPLPAQSEIMKEIDRVDADNLYIYEIKA